MSNKREYGVYYTTGNPFENPAFKNWSKAANIPATRVLEPFAGSNNLIERLKVMGLCDKHTSYDITPNHPAVVQRDTLTDFPGGYSVCITNPPWLAKNSATVRGLDFPDTIYDDLYKVALNECLNGCGYVAALVPESFIRAGLFKCRLTDFVSLTGDMFTDTGHPVGLALFAPQPSRDVMVWRNSDKIGLLSALERSKPDKSANDIRVHFNAPDGNVGLIALDNTIEASIRFCEVDELKNYNVKSTGRHITKIRVEGDVRIKDWNDWIKSFRDKTWDVLLTSYKGLRKDGLYRRRLDWSIARGIINDC